MKELKKQESVASFESKMRIRPRGKESKIGRINFDFDAKKSGILDQLEDGDIDIGQDCENVSELPEENEVILGD